MNSYRRWFISSMVGLLLPFSPVLYGQAKTQWNGASNNEWRNPLNWSAGVPTPSLDVTISQSAPLVHEVYVPAPAGADTAQIMNLALSNGGVLRFDSLGVLLVWGTDKLQNLGAVYLGYGSIIFKYKMTFHNGGVFDAGAGMLSFEGVTWESKLGSTFRPGTSTVVFNKPSDQSLIIDSTLNLTFHDLVLNTQGTLTIDGTVTVLNSCTIAVGCTLNIPAGSSLIVEGEFTNNGTITGGGNYPGALPVQMTEFIAKGGIRDAELRWKTETEVDNLGFEVERRLVQGLGFKVQGPQPETLNLKLETQWSKVAFVRGSGTSTSPKEYSYTDRHLPAGRYAYRIKQIDNNGTFRHSDAVELEIGLAPKALSLGSNYPNPFNPSTTIEFTLPENGRARLRVFDIIGQEVATVFDQTAEAGKLYRATFSTSTLPSGLYFYRLEFQNQSIVRRMTLVK